MGQAVIELAQKQESFLVKAGVVKTLPSLESRLVALFKCLNEALKSFEDKSSPPVIIDFSQANLAHAEVALAAEHGCPFLLATTGHDESITKTLEKAALRIPMISIKDPSLMAHVMFPCQRWQHPYLKRVK